MPTLRLALNQIDTTVSDITGWTERVVRWTRHAVEQGAQLVAFPGTALQPCSVETSRSALLELAQRLAAEGLGETPVILGHPGSSHTDDPCQDSPQNCAALLHRGQAVTRPDTLPVVRVHGVDVAPAVSADIRPEGAGLLLVVGASPFAAGQDDARLELARRRAREAGCSLAWVNPVGGGQDELVYDGDSVVVDAEGQLLARAPQFEEGCLLLDLDLPAATGATTTAFAPEPAERVTPGLARRMEELEAIYAALVCGVRAYVGKSPHDSVLIGLSGGIGSALVAAIAVDALGAENVHGASMPSEASAQQARDDAAELARRTGLGLRTVPITPVLGACLSALGLTAPADGNLRSGVRGTLLTALAEQEGHLVLTPADKSELAIGQAAPYGEPVGAFGPLRDVHRTLVLRLARWRNAAASARGETPPIPEHLLAEPSAAGSLPEPEVLDAILTAHLGEHRDREQLTAQGFAPEAVERALALVEAARRKTRQHPPGIRITPGRQPSGARGTARGTHH